MAELDELIKIREYLEILLSKDGHYLKQLSPEKQAEIKAKIEK